MSNNQTIWVDLTDLSSWKGYHTGIQRVVYNIAKEYAVLKNARFFTYNEAKRIFVEVDFTPVDLTRKIVPPTSKRKEIKKRLKYYAKNNYIRLPLGFRKYITPKLKPVAGRAYHTLHHVAHIVKTNRDAMRRSKGLKLAYFAPGDVVLVLGAGWANPTILEELGHLKKHNGFKIFHFVHDLIPVYFPHLFGPGHFELSVSYFFDVATYCDGFITNSRSSESDMRRFCKELDLPQLPSCVIRLGDELECSSEHAGLRYEPKSYILAVSTIEARKNYALLYSVYKLAATRGAKLPGLIIVGRPGWNAGDTVYALKHDPEVWDNIILLQDVNDSELAWLYDNCMFTVYPSLYEGWGLPIAESLVRGKLCLASKTSSMPEIAGDLIDYFEPFDSSECLSVILKYLDTEILSKSEKAIKKGYRVQTWAETFREMNAGIENLSK